MCAFKSKIYSDVNEQMVLESWKAVTVARFRDKLLSITDFKVQIAYNRKSRIYRVG